MWASRSLSNLPVIMSSKDYRSCYWNSGGNFLRASCIRLGFNGTRFIRILQSEKQLQMQWCVNSSLTPGSWEIGGLDLYEKSVCLSHWLFFRFWIFGVDNLNLFAAQNTFAIRLTQRFSHTTHLLFYGCLSLQFFDRGMISSSIVPKTGYFD